MALVDNILDNLTGYSKAMYSAWYYYKPGRLLFDAGEGVSCALENFVFGIESVFLSHGHYDHVSGLPGIIRSRASARGDKEKPLTVYFPEDDRLILLMREYIGRMSPDLLYDLVWEGVGPGSAIPLEMTKDRGTVKAFRVPHSRRMATLGYNLVERRQRLKPEYRSLSTAEVGRLAKEKGRAELMEEYEHILVAYGGDSVPLDPADIARAEVLMHDCTFLRSDDRGNEVHSTLAEALQVGRDADVKALVLVHVSSRYRRSEIAEELRRQTHRPTPFPVYLFLGRRKYHWQNGQLVPVHS